MKQHPDKAFVQFLDEKLKNVTIRKKQQTAPQSADFLQQLNQYLKYLDETTQVARSGSSYSIQLKKTTREAELKQQKQIIQLEQKLGLLKKEASELRVTNHELYVEVKKQKSMVKSLQRDEAQYNKQRLEWDRKLTVMEKNIVDQQQLSDHVKHILNYMNDEIDQQALVIAKRQFRKQ